jgi:hypothetical protein
MLPSYLACGRILGYPSFVTNSPYGTQQRGAPIAKKVIAAFKRKIRLLKNRGNEIA